MESLKENIKAGALAGVIWGCLSYLTNLMTGAFPFEASIAQAAASFTFAGAVFGVVAGGLLTATGRFIPFKGTVLKAVCVSVGIWVALKVGGDTLSVMDPERYHMVTPQSVQGFALSILLGVILGLMAGRSGAMLPENA